MEIIFLRITDNIWNYAASIDLNIFNSGVWGETGGDHSRNILAFQIQTQKVYLQR